MPITGGATPTVTVSVPVPTPVPTKKRAPVSFGPSPQAPAPPQPVAPPPQPTAPVDPGPRAIIFPWSPSPEGKMRQSRVGGVRRYSSPHTAENGTLNSEQLGMAEQAAGSGDWTNWGALADHLQESGYPNTGDVIARVATRDEGTSYDELPYRTHWALFRVHGHGRFSHSLGQGQHGPVRTVAMRVGDYVHVFRHRVPDQPAPTQMRRLPRRVARYTNHNRPRRYGRLRTVQEYGGITGSFIDALDNSTGHGDSPHNEHPMILADFLQDEDDPRVPVIRRAQENGYSLQDGYAGRPGYYLRDDHQVSGDFGDLGFRVVAKGTYKRNARNKELVTEVGFPSPKHQYRGVYREAFTTPEESRAMIDAIPHEGHRAAAHAFIDKHFGARPTTVTQPTSMSRNRQRDTSTLPKKVIRYKTPANLIVGGNDQEKYLFPEERDSLLGGRESTRKEFRGNLNSSLNDRPGTLPTLSEVKSLAEVGVPVKGSYNDAHRTVTKLLGNPQDAHRWVTANAILSAQTGWEAHTAGATEALAAWHEAGRPTTVKELDAIFGETGRTPAGASAITRRGVFKGPDTLTGSKVDGLKAMFATGNQFPGVEWGAISKGSLKTPNFGLAFVDPRGVPIDTHMAKLTVPGNPFGHKTVERLIAGTNPGRKTTSDLLDAQKSLIEKPHAALAYKSLLSKAAEDLGWEPREVQEAVWVASLAVMVAKNHGAGPQASSILSKLTRKAVQAGWSLNTVLTKPEVQRDFAKLGISPRRITQAIAASGKRLPAGPGRPGTSDPSALESAALRLPAEIAPAAKPIAARLSRREAVLRFSAHDSLPALLRAARQNPNEATVHGMIADALDEAHPGNHVAELIRRQYGLGQQTEPHENLWWGDSFGQSITHGVSVGGAPWGHAHIGTDGPFNMYLGHEGNDGQSPRWTVHAVSRLQGSQHHGYTFEFPHEEAHLIPQMFPGAAAHISEHNGPRRVNEKGRIPQTFTEDEWRNREAQRFNENMSAE